MPKGTLWHWLAAKSVSSSYIIIETWVAINCAVFIACHLHAKDTSTLNTSGTCIACCMNQSIFLRYSICYSHFLAKTDRAGPLDLLKKSWGTRYKTYWKKWCVIAVAPMSPVSFVSSRLRQRDVRPGYFIFHTFAAKATRNHHLLLKIRWAEPGSLSACLGLSCSLVLRQD